MFVRKVIPVVLCTTFAGVPVHRPPHCLMVDHQMNSVRMDKLIARQASRTSLVIRSIITDGGESEVPRILLLEQVRV